MYYLQGTGGNTDMVEANGDQFNVATAGGYTSGISAAAGTYFTLTGSNDGIGLSTGDTLNANGGGNTISAVADTDVYLQGTGGNTEMVEANHDQFNAATVGGYNWIRCRRQNIFHFVTGSK